MLKYYYLLKLHCTIFVIYISTISIYLSTYVRKHIYILNRLSTHFTVSRRDMAQRVETAVKN